MLAFIMFAGVFPTTAAALIDPPLNGSTGTGWADFDPAPGEIGSPVMPPPSFNPPDEPLRPIPPPNIPDFDLGEDDTIPPPDDLPTEGDNEVDGDEEMDAPLDEDSIIAAGDSETVNCPLSTVNCDDMPPDLAAALLAYAKAVDEVIANRSPIAPAAMPGDIGTIQFQNEEISGLPIDLNYFPVINWTNRPGEALTPFCAAFGPDPREGVPYVASAHSNTQILRLLVAYEDGLISERLAVQVAIWGIVHNWQSWSNWGPAAAARQAASGVDIAGWRLLRFAGPAGAQPLFAVVAPDSDPDDPDDPDPGPGDGDDDKQFEVRWSIESHTETTFVREATIEITDARGQLMIRKQNQNHDPLDGALFNIRIDFSDGTHQQINGWEAYNGGRLLTWNHPVGNRDAATVTVTEVRAPQHYSIDSNNTRTVSVSPSYTLWEHVTYWEETVTTYTYWWEVILIQNGEESTVDRVEYDSGQTISRSAWNRNTTTDSVVGDLHQSVTFVNERIRGQLIVYKRCAVTGQLLQGAEFRVEGVDLGNAGTFNQTGVTGPGGYVVFNNLFPGSYRVTEIRAPHTHNTDAPPQTTTIQSNETVRLTFENTRRQGLNILKVDPDGNPLQGAVFEVRRGSGQVLGSFITDSNGLIIIPSHYLTTGYYVVEEIQAPDGYLIDSENNPQTIWIDNTQQNQTYSLVFRNFRMPSLEIIKVDAATGDRLADAAFRVTNTRTGHTFDVRTDANGRAYLPRLDLDTTYLVEETQAPPGFVRTEYTHSIVLRENRTHTITVENHRQPSLRIVKRDAITGHLLPGAVFRLAPEGSNNHREVTTNQWGEVTVTGLQPGTWILTEVRSPTGYLLDDTPRTIIIREGEHNTVEVLNYRAPSIEITKRDTHTGRLLPGAVFRISWNHGAYFRDITTNAEGVAIAEDLSPGWFTIIETRAPDGYILDDTPRQVYLEPGERHTITILNEAMPTLVISKVCSVTGNPLPQARFRVERITGTGISLIGEFVTNELGLIILENVEPGRFRITEIAPPPGFLVDRTVHEVTIAAGQRYELLVTNTPQAPILIRKVDPQGNPLLGAEFVVTTMNGAHVATVQSAHTGYAIVPNVQPGWYIVQEVRSPDGYILSNTPQNVEVFAGRPALVTFVNHRYPTLQIAKVDADNGRPLLGATFRITEANGRFVGEHTTGPDGLITLTDLAPGVYIVTEIRSPDGYILDMTPQTVELRAGQIARLEFRNVSIPGLQLIKLCSATGQPVEGAVFNVTELRGGFQRSLGTFTTGINGTFFIPDLTPGHFVITEIRAAPGFILDRTPQNIHVEGGRINVVEFFNTPYSNLRLVKICAETRQPLPDAVFRLFDAQRREIGTFTTDSTGVINLTELPSGIYFIQEVRAPAGFLLDTTVRQVELQAGQLTTLEWPNTPLGSLRIIKVDADTRQPLFGVEFELLDMRNNILGRFTTDRDGVIAFSRNLAPGRYQVREVRAAEGYLLDDRLHVVTIRPDETFELVVENRLMVGNIQIVKRAASANAITGDRAGATLEGAVFEIVNERLEVVDTITTDSRGIAVSRDLPLGRYAIQEITSPDFYLLYDGVFYADIRMHGDLIQFEVLNHPADLEVTIDKRGNVEALAGDVIRYDFTNIANESNVALDDFFWRDILPEEVRLERIVTGTWSDRVRYRLVYTTNLNSNNRVWRDNMLSTVNHELDVSDLNLAANEFVTSFRFEFGTVPPGFREVDAPYIFVRVLDDLPHEHRIVNRVEVGGRVGDDFVYDLDSWVTIVFAFPRGPLPQTGLQPVDSGQLTVDSYENSDVGAANRH